jgi:phenylacetate-CoA ligase
VSNKPKDKDAPTSRSALAQLGFPRILPPQSAIIADVLAQLDRHSRLPEADQQRLLARQAALLLGHARRHSPYWRNRLQPAGDSVDLAALTRVPILTRTQLQQGGTALHAFGEGMTERQLSTASTSGSTGQPVTVKKLIAIARPTYAAASMLEKRWQQMDPEAVTAVIRDAPDGAHRVQNPLVSNRPSMVHVRNLIRHSPQALLEWLRALRPRFLITVPSMAERLAQLALAKGGGPPIDKIMAFAEVVTARQRSLCQAAFGARIVNRYSSEEVGWIALQCPKHDHLHVLSSLVHVEIVDGDGAPCPPGKPGHVLLTGLHSYPMPLIRYAIGDVAEFGPRCDCGITLPVIRRVLGRQRNFLRMPDGSDRLARLAGDHWQELPEVREFRLVQYGDGVVEAFLRCDTPLGPQGQARARALLQRVLGHPFAVVVTEVAAIDWGNSYKREEFVRKETPWPGRKPPDAEA